MADNDAVHRAFLSELEDDYTPCDCDAKAPESDEAFAALRSGVVGAGQCFTGPFGEKSIIYADWTASGRALAQVESYIDQRVLPYYANTHTSTSITGLQSTCYRHEARQIIAEAVNANRTTDVVLFSGSGSTAAVNKLVEVLGLRTMCTRGSVPVVFVGPHEHHSNLLPWRESSAEVVHIREDARTGTVDLAHLESSLVSYADRPLRIGSFSAASNVTGVCAPVDQVTALLHRHGALACWDYATAAPYVRVDMNPVLAGDDPDRAFVHKDAVFISPHKFVGGVNTPGVLVVKKRLLGNAVPAAPHVGGGTVFFVTEDSHRYLSNRVEREEGGTPDVLGAIRAGLAFRVKQRVGVAAIEAREQHLWEMAASLIGAHPAIALLGPPVDPPATPGIVAPRLPIFSFLVRYTPSGDAPATATPPLFLHYNFVSALLNDLFGVQARGGCMCAGPYAQRLLGMSRDAVEAIENELVSQNCEYLRPGFTRISFPYFVADAARISTY